MPVHHSILTMPIPSLDEVLKIDPLILERPMSLIEAAEFLGCTRDTLVAMRKRNQGPRFVRPNEDRARIYTTPRLCLNWLQSADKQAKKQRARLFEDAVEEAN